MSLALKKESCCHFQRIRNMVKNSLSHTFLITLLEIYQRVSFLYWSRKIGESRKIEQRKKLVKTLKINKLFIWPEKLNLRRKTRQNAEDKQTFDFFSRKNEIEEETQKTLIWAEKLKLKRKTRQNAENFWNFCWYFFIDFLAYLFCVCVVRWTVI